MSISISEIIEDQFSLWTACEMSAGEPVELDLDDSPVIRAWREEAVQAAIEAPCTGDLEKWSFSLSAEADKLLAELPKEQRTPEYVHPAECQKAWELLREIQEITEQGFILCLALEVLDGEEAANFFERWFCRDQRYLQKMPDHEIEMALEYVASRPPYYEKNEDYRLFMWHLLCAERKRREG